MGKPYSISDWTDKDCEDVEKVFASLEGRYTMLLVSAFVLEGEMSFGRLGRELGINSKTLSKRLIRLQKDGIIKNRRQKEGEVQKSYYSLNGNQEELEGLLKAFRVFSKSKVN